MIQVQQLIQTSNFHDVPWSKMLTRENKFSLKVIYALGSAHEKFDV